MGIWLVPRVGAVRMQVLGFAGMAVGMLLLAWASGLPAADPARVEIVILGFVLFNLAMNMGPNSTTFTLPALLFPTTLRSTASGFAAACAKAGATLGTFFLPDLRARFGTTAMLLVLAGVSVLGVLVTVLFRRPARSASANLGPDYYRSEVGGSGGLSRVGGWPAARLRPPGRSPRRRNSTTVRATMITGNATPSARKARRSPMPAIIQLKFMPKKPVTKVIGRKISETSVSRLIWSL